MKISAGRLSIYFILLAVPPLVALALPLYNRVDPTLAGLSFFYWFQTFLLGFAVVPYLIYSWMENRRMEKEGRPA